MGARAGHFAGGSLGTQAPSLARRVSTSSLDPRRTPASRDRRPSASKRLKHKGPGWEQPVYVAENTETPPSRPHHCEDPPVLPSVKGSPFTDGRTGGRPPGDGFCPSRGWLVSGPDVGPRMRGKAPNHKQPSGQRAPPLAKRARLTGSLESCPGKGKPSVPPRRPRVFPWNTLPGSSPTPARQSAQRRPGRLGREPGAGKVSRPVEPAPSSGTHAHRRVLPGDSGLSPAWAVKSLALVQTAPPCPLAANLDLATSTL